MALQGLGVCGYKALKLLVDEGAKVVVTDVDDTKVKSAVAEFGVTACAPDAIYDQDVEIFAPYALGAVINDDTIGRLKCRIVAGSANNIFAEERHGDALQARGIVYAVDYVANSGGTIFDTDRFRKGGFQRERAWANVRRVYDRTLEVFSIADAENIPFYKAADQLAERRIEALNGVRLLETKAR